MAVDLTEERKRMEAMIAAAALQGPQSMGLAQAAGMNTAGLMGIGMGNGEPHPSQYASGSAFADAHRSWIKQREYERMHHNGYHNGMMPQSPPWSQPWIDEQRRQSQREMERFAERWAGIQPTNTSAEKEQRGPSIPPMSKDKRLLLTNK